VVVETDRRVAEVVQKFTNVDGVMKNGKMELGMLIFEFLYLYI
jgi:hypothetical protein